MTRRGFLTKLTALAGAMLLPAAKAAGAPKPVLEALGEPPIFELRGIPLPVVHGDFWFTLRVPAGSLKPEMQPGEFTTRVLNGWRRDEAQG